MLDNFHASVAIPAFNEGHRLPQMLHELAARGDRDLPATEFVVVDDGSRASDAQRYEETVAETARVLPPPHRIALVTSPRNQGKGASVRLGWARADAGARWLGFVDADGAVPAHEVWRLIRRSAADDADVIAGSRIRMAGRLIDRNLVRHLQGRVFATFVDLAFKLGFYDTQCGLKLVRASLLRPLLPALREDRWMLDVELLVLLRAAGARCIEEPIDWLDPGGSKVVPLIDPLRMMAAIVGLRRRFVAAKALPP